MVARRRQKISWLAFALAFALMAADTCASESDRQRVFISDHHMGVGRDGAGNWRAEEDFRWAEEFKLFLDKMHELGGGKTDLVIVGDFLELWQSEGNDCNHDLDGNGKVEGSERDYGCTEGEALARTQKVIAQHRNTLNHIGDFASKGRNHVYILPGNHDAALLFSRVATALLDGISAPDNRVTIRDEGYWLSPDGLIYAEHGQQIPDDVNSWQNWPKPFLVNPRTRERHLRRSWGEQFVQDFYNKWEGRFPIIDNIAKETEGVCYGVAAGGPVEAGKAVVDFLKFFLFEVSLNQFVGWLELDERKIKWDVGKIRKDGDIFLVESMPSNHPIRPAVQKALKEDRLTITVREEKAVPMLPGGKARVFLTNEQITEICDRRAAQHALEKRGGRRTISRCPAKDRTLSATVGQVFRTNDERHRIRLEQVNDDLRATGRPKHSLKIFVYGHTHKAKKGWTPFGRGANWRPRVINSGAWQRVVTAEELVAVRQRRELTKDKVLAVLRPEDLPPKYSYVVVKPYANTQPTAHLCWWQQARTGQWHVWGEECTGEDLTNKPMWDTDLSDPTLAHTCGEIEEHGIWEP